MLLQIHAHLYDWIKLYGCIYEPLNVEVQMYCIQWKRPIHIASQLEAPMEAILLIEFFGFLLKMSYFP